MKALAEPRQIMSDSLQPTGSAPAGRHWSPPRPVTLTEKRTEGKGRRKGSHVNNIWIRSIFVIVTLDAGSNAVAPAADRSDGRLTSSNTFICNLPSLCIGLNRTKFKAPWSSSFLKEKRIVRRRKRFPCNFPFP